MLILAALLVGASVVEAPCEASYTRVLEAELSVYLDPSDRNQTRTTKRVVADILKPFREDLQHPRCAVRVGCALADFGTPKMVVRALQAEARFYESAAEGTGTNHGVPDPSGDLPDVGDLRLASAALDTCTKDLGFQASDGLTDPDPRKWDPTVVARAIDQIRRSIAKSRATNGSAEAPRRVLVQNTTDAIADDGALVSVPGPGKFAYYPFARLGLSRYFGLIGDPESANACCQEHFPGETDLYSLEWKNRPPDSPDRKFDSFVKYQAARWKETDDAAPHPDMDAVWAALEKLERTPPGSVDRR